MAKRTMNASISIPRSVFDAVESLADQASNGVFSRTASQLMEIGHMALKCGWTPPPGWWPESGRQVPLYFGAHTSASPGASLPGAEGPLGPTVAPEPALSATPEPASVPDAEPAPSAAELL